MLSEYFIDGNVDRAKIAMQIKYRKIKRDAIEELCADPRIKAAFRGTSFPNKRPKKEWNAEYLDLLSYVSVAGEFNRDYLLYLDEVAEYVSKVKYKKIFIAGAVIILVIIAGVSVWWYICHKPTALEPDQTLAPGRTDSEVISDMQDVFCEKMAASEPGKTLVPEETGCEVISGMQEVCCEKIEKGAAL